MSPLSRRRQITWRFSNRHCERERLQLLFVFDWIAFGGGCAFWRVDLFQCFWRISPGSVDLHKYQLTNNTKCNNKRHPVPFIIRLNIASESVAWESQLTIGANRIVVFALIRFELWPTHLPVAAINHKTYFWPTEIFANFRCWPKFSPKILSHGKFKS